MSAKIIDLYGWRRERLRREANDIAVREGDPAEGEHRDLDDRDIERMADNAMIRVAGPKLVAAIKRCRETGEVAPILVKAATGRMSSYVGEPGPGEEVCPACDGAGFVGIDEEGEDDECITCKGNGIVPEEEAE